MQQQRTREGQAALPATTRTEIDDISSSGETLSPSQMRLVNGGDGATATALNRGTDYDWNTLDFLAFGG